MTRKRKRKIFPAAAAIDINDIETQVERDRLKELEQKSKCSSSSNFVYTRDKFDSYYTDKILGKPESCSSDYGSARNSYSQREQTSISSTKSFRTLNKNYVKRILNNHAGCSSTTTHNLDMPQKDMDLNPALWYDGDNTSINDSQNISEDNDLVNINKPGETKVVADECLEEYVTLDDVALLEEDVDSLEIDGNLIVQRYLENLEVPANAGSEGSKYYPVEQPGWPSQREQRNDAKICLMTSQFRRKSSLRKTAADETNKTSVSFQEPYEVFSRRAKSASGIRKEDRKNQGLRPGTALHKTSAMKVSNRITESPDDRPESNIPYISSDNKIQDSLHLPSMNGEINETIERKRKTSAVSRVSGFSYHSRQRCPSTTFDPELEKASAYIHGGPKQFSRANTSITPVKYGLKHLQMNYSENNLEHNQSVIFLDLLKNACNKSQIRFEEIRSVERRLEQKRTNPLYATTYYEHKNIVDPYRVKIKKVARTVAQKKKERKEKIKKMTDEVCGSFVPTCLTMKIADQKEVEDIGRHCRYLRCNQPSVLEISKSDSEPVQVVVTKA